MISGTTVIPLTSFTDALTIADRLLHNQFVAFKTSAGLWDDLGYQIDGVSTAFSTTWAPIDPATLVVLVDGKPGTPTVQDAESGTFTLGAAPGETLKARYNFQPLPDATVQNCVVQALLRLQRYNDITLVPIGLYPAMFEWVKGLGKKALARRYAERINIGLGPRREDWKAVSQDYDKAGEEDMKQGDIYRDQFYKRAGQQFVPAAAVAGPYIVDTYTPIR